MQCNPKDPESFPFVVLGNKVDKTNERKVTTEQAQEWCKKNNDISYYETSAKEKTMLEEAFTQVAKKAST